MSKFCLSTSCTLNLWHLSSKLTLASLLTLSLGTLTLNMVAAQTAAPVVPTSSPVTSPGSGQNNSGPSIGGILPLVSVGQRWAQNTEKGLGGKPTVLTVGCRTQAARRAA